MARRKHLSIADPDPEDVYFDALDSGRPEYLDCREFHDWAKGPYRYVDTDYEDRRPRQGYRQFAERKLTCKRCGMVRTDSYAVHTSHGGHTALTPIGTPSYDAPEGYYIKGSGNTRGKRDILRGVQFDLAMQAAAKPKPKRKRG